MALSAGYNFCCFESLLIAEEAESKVSSPSLAQGCSGREGEMSWRGKRKEDEGFASGGDSDSHKRQKQDEEESDSITVCEISKNRRVSVRHWQGKIWVDIREFYLKDGKQMPGKKGISLNLEQWNILREHIEEIDKAVSES